MGPSAQHPGHEDAGATTEWSCRRRLEELADATPSKQKTGQCVETELDRQEWGLKWNQALETGGVLVANKVRIEGEVQFVKQEA